MNRLFSNPSIIAAALIAAVSAASLAQLSFDSTDTHQAKTVNMKNVAANVVTLPAITVYADPVDQAFYRAYTQAQRVPVVTLPTITVHADPADQAFYRAYTQAQRMAVVTLPTITVYADDSYINDLAGVVIDELLVNATSAR